MDKIYWLRRQHAAVAAARLARTSESRLMHYERAGRYSIRAAHAPAPAAASCGGGR
jgi:hypothetical protein